MSSYVQDGWIELWAALSMLCQLDGTVGGLKQTVVISFPTSGFWQNPASYEIALSIRNGPFTEVLEWMYYSGKRSSFG